jgi:hypothetical protein
MSFGFKNRPDVLCGASEKFGSWPPGTSGAATVPRAMCRAAPETCASRPPTVTLSAGSVSLAFHAAAEFEFRDVLPAPASSPLPTGATVAHMPSAACHYPRNWAAARTLICQPKRMIEGKGG